MNDDISVEEVVGLVRIARASWLDCRPDDLTAAAALAERPATVIALLATLVARMDEHVYEGFVEKLLAAVLESGTGAANV